MFDLHGMEAAPPGAPRRGYERYFSSLRSTRRGLELTACRCHLRCWPALSGKWSYCRLSQQKGRRAVQPLDACSPNDVIDNAHLKKTTYVLPWAIHTISLSSIDDTLPRGRLTNEGMDLIADAVDNMIRP